MVSAAKAAPEKIEDAWHPARLIPTTGIGGQDEQEQRATSSLLAVMQAVPDFGRALLRHLDAPAGRIRTFSEVRFKSVVDKKVSIPDGGIVVDRGKTEWRCLVEVKTGTADLRPEQVATYLDLARDNGIQAVLTISNQITSSPGEPPFAVDPRKLKKVALRHLSWWHIMTDAIEQHRHRGVTDPDQAWILGELIAYLDNERSGASGFTDMGDKWVAVRDGARALTLRAKDPAAREVAQRWVEFVQWLALGLRQDLGRDVTAGWARNQTPSDRLGALVEELEASGRLQASVRVPGAINAVDISVDLRTRLVTTSVNVAAPRDGRAKTRITWLLRQLRDAPARVRVDASFPMVKETTSAMLTDAVKDPEMLLWSRDPKREPRSFTVALSREMGIKRGKGQGSFVAESKQQVVDFYRLVVQSLKPWTAGAPKLPAPQADPEMVASPTPPEYTGSARDPGEGIDPEHARRSE